MKEVSIVMPAYNEENNIEKTVVKCSNVLNSTKLSTEIIVVEDGSKDRTKEILENLKKSIPNLIVVIHEKNMGYGRAVSDGIKAATGKYLMTLDSDGQFDIGQFPIFLEKIKEGAGIVTGYRIKKKDTFLKVLANTVLNNLVKYSFKINVKDINCSFRLYEKSLFDKISMEASHFILPTEILLKANALSYKISEVGVNHAYREGGKSSIKLLKNTLEILSFLFKLKKKIKQYKKGEISIL